MDDLEKQKLLEHAVDYWVEDNEIRKNTINPEFVEVFKNHLFIFYGNLMPNYINMYGYLDYLAERFDLLIYDNDGEMWEVDICKEMVDEEDQYAFAMGDSEFYHSYISEYYPELEFRQGFSYA